MLLICTCSVPLQALPPPVQGASEEGVSEDDEDKDRVRREITMAERCRQLPSYRFSDHKEAAISRWQDGLEAPVEGVLDAYHYFYGKGFPDSRSYLTLAL